MAEETISFKQVDQLSTFLENHSVMTLPWLHGFLTAVMSAPEAIAFVTWFKPLEIIDDADRQQAETAAYHAIALSKTIRQQLAHNDFIPLTHTAYPYHSLHYREGLQQWTGGYCFAVEQVCKFWQRLDETIVNELLLPITLLSLDDEAFKSALDDLGYYSADINQIQQHYAKSLPLIVENIYCFWKTEKQYHQRNNIVSLADYRQLKQDALLKEITNG